MTSPRGSNSDLGLPLKTYPDYATIDKVTREITNKYKEDFRERRAIHSLERDQKRWNEME